MSCNFFANKWDFEQMGFSDRKIQGLCENGKILVKKLPNETVLRTKTLRFLKMGIGKTLQLFREQMGFRTNGILEPNSLTQKRKWDPICSRAYCRFRPHAGALCSERPCTPYGAFLSKKTQTTYGKSQWVRVEGHPPNSSRAYRVFRSTLE